VSHRSSRKKSVDDVAVELLKKLIVCSRIATPKRRFAAKPIVEAESRGPVIPVSRWNRSKNVP
jgi:hypothetical protein